MSLPILIFFLAGILGVGAAIKAKTTASVRARHAAWAQREPVQTAPGTGGLAGATRPTVLLTHAPAIQTVSAVYRRDERGQRGSPRLSELTLIQSTGSGQSDPLRISEATNSPLAGLRASSVSETAYMLPALRWGQLSATSSVDVMGGVWDSREILSVEFSLDGGGLLEALIAQILAEQGVQFVDRLPVFDDFLQMALEHMQSEAARFGVELLTAEDGFLAQRLIREIDKIYCDWLGDVADKFDQIVDAIDQMIRDPLTGPAGLVRRIRELVELFVDLRNLPELLEQLRFLSAKVNITFDLPQVDVTKVLADLLDLIPSTISALAELLSNGPFSSLDKLLARLFGKENLWSILSSMSCGGHLTRMESTAERLSPRSAGDSIGGEIEGISSDLEAIGAALE